LPCALAVPAVCKPSNNTIRVKRDFKTHSLLVSNEASAMLKIVAIIAFTSLQLADGQITNL
jgi:hypothetical protein